LKTFKRNIDLWIKQIRAEISEIKWDSEIVKENVGNIQHNYELIFQLKDEIESLKGEIKALKLVQLLQIREKL